MDLPELETWLDSFIDPSRQHDRAANLPVMQLLCAHFGHPENSCPCFHVTGSKGKGTITADLAAIFRAAGYKTGCYMSPHVSHFTERVGTGAEPFAPATYAAAFRQLQLGIDSLIASGAVEKDMLTWFQLVTIFSMLCFRIEKVNIAIYEVGIGGRFDATNVITPVCCCFGPIELEHTRSLGPTLSSIAADKSGIIKPKVPVISAPQPPDVKAILDGVAASLQTKVNYVSLQKYPHYLRQDAEVARRAAKVYLPNLPDATIAAALQNVQLPGRYEIIKDIPGYPGTPYLIIDAAHTAGSITQVLSRLRLEGHSGNLLFGCAVDKNIAELARAIKASRQIKDIYLTRPGDFKQSDITKMRNTFQRAGRPCTAASPDYANFIPEILQKCSDTHTPLIILGSFYLAGEVKKRLAQS